MWQLYCHTMLHAPRSTLTTLQSVKVHGALPHIWPKRARCLATCNTHTHNRLAFIGPSPPASSYQLSFAREFVTVLLPFSLHCSCDIFQLLLLPLPLYAPLWLPSGHLVSPLVFVSITFSVLHLHTLPHNGKRKPYPVLRLHFWGRTLPPTPTSNPTSNPTSHLARIWIRSRSRIWLQHLSGF